MEQPITDDEDTVPALPILEPITERPIELDARLWAEWKAQRLFCHACGARFREDCNCVSPLSYDIPLECE